MRIGFQRVVTSENLLRNRPGAVESGDRGEQVVGADVMRLEDPAAAGDITCFGRTRAFKAAAGLRLIAEYGNVPSGNLTVADQKNRRRKRGDPAADEIETGLLGDWII